MATLDHSALSGADLHDNKPHHATHEAGGSDALTGILTNPMTTAADLIVGGAAGAPARLGKGTDGQVLTVDPVTHLLVWATPAPGGPAFAAPAIALGSAAAAGAAATVIRSDATIAAFDATAPTTAAFGDAAATGSDPYAARRGHRHGMMADPLPAHVAAADPHAGYVLESLVTAAGDLLVGSGSAALARLGKGADGTVLTVDPVTHLLVWAVPPGAGGGMTNPMTTAGDLIVGGSAGAAGRLGVGSAGQVLAVVSGAPAWSAPSGMADPMTTNGDLIVRAGGAPARLGVGSAGQVLTVVSGAPAWAAASGGGSGVKTYVDAFGTVGVAGPTSPTPAAGDVWLPPDTFFLAVYSGSAWVPRGPLYPFGMVDPSAFTDPASTGGSTDTASGGLNLTAAANNQILRMRGKATPATPYVITARVFIHAQTGGDGDRGGLYWRDSAGGHIQRCVLEWASGAIRLASYENSDPSTFVQTLAQIDVPAARRDPHAWLRLSDDGTTRKFEVLVDGFHPVTIDSRGHTSLFTPNQVGLVAQAPNAGSAVAVWLQSWKES